MAPKKVMPDLTTPEGIELSYKLMQVELMQEQMNERRERKERLEHDRQQRYRDFLKSQEETRHRQRVCRHKKGGKNNNFALGNAADSSVVQNTYPDGRVCIMCTRCGKEVWQPTRELKKSDPAVYAEQLKLWQEWSHLSTDNTPSGSKVFEIYRDAA
jgi:acetyl-CoA carboxylase carboxyltransferase component